jgi:FkbM family methyltransferase
MREHIKKIWKYSTRPLLKVYARNFSLHIDNYPHLPVAGAYSQFGQDVFVLKKVFPNKTDGIFVDVGGNHPINCSNTYLLEQSGWHGIAFEPQEKMRDLWPSLRKTPCLPYVIGPENKTVTFVEAAEGRHGLSGVDHFNKSSEGGIKISLEQRRLDEILQEQNIHHIDYLSIDVEGYEMEVLKSIDFSRADITLISVENDIGFRWLPLIGKKLGSELGTNSLRKYLEKNGYTYIARIVCDDFFMKK